jgi:hypothetical protein
MRTKREFFIVIITLDGILLLDSKKGDFLLFVFSLIKSALSPYSGNITISVKCFFENNVNTIYHS